MNLQTLRDLTLMGYSPQPRLSSITLGVRNRFKGWKKSVTVKYDWNKNGEAVNDERRRIRAICQRESITRKKFRKLQKIARREERIKRAEIKRQEVLKVPAAMPTPVAMTTVVIPPPEPVKIPEPKLSWWGRLKRALSRIFYRKPNGE